MQLQFNRWQRHRNLPIPNLILRTRGYAGHNSKGHRSHTYKLLKHLLIFRRHIGCDRGVNRYTQTKTSNDSGKRRC